MGRVTTEKFPAVVYETATRAYRAIHDQIAAGNQGVARQLMEAGSKAYYAPGATQFPLNDPEWDELCLLWAGKFGSPFRVARAAAGEDAVWPLLGIKPSPKGPRLDRRAGSQQDYPTLSNFIDQDLRSLEELADWHYRYALAGSTMLCSPKYDGMAMTISYDRHGKVLKAVTRGDDGMGVDATRMFAGEKHFEQGPGPAEPPFDMEVPFGVKYEAVMRWADVEALSEATGKTYKSPRGTVAGIISSDRSRERRKYVVLVPLGLWFDGAESAAPFQDRMDEVALFEEDFLPHFTANGDVPTPWDWEQCSDVEGVRAFHDRTLALRNSEGFDYMLDGVVVELHSREDIERLGGRSERPKWVAKLKFPYMVASTKAISVDFDVGNTGRVTPVVNFEDVVLNGYTYNRTSIANFTRFDELRLGPGSPLTFELRNDVSLFAP